MHGKVTSDMAKWHGKVTSGMTKRQVTWKWHDICRRQSGIIDLRGKYFLQSGK
jgi:hypothetical protein